MPNKKQKLNRETKRINISPDLIRNFISKKLKKEEQLLFFSCLALIILSTVALSTGVFAPSVPRGQIIKESAVKQGQVVAGQPVKWIRVVAVDQIQGNKKYLELPKDAKNITIKTGQAILSLLGESEKELTIADRKELATIIQSKTQKPNILAEAWHSLTASVEDAISQLKDTFKEEKKAAKEEEKEQKKEEPEIIETKDSQFVDLSIFIQAEEVIVPAEEIIPPAEEIVASQPEEETPSPLEETILPIEEIASVSEEPIVPAPFDYIAVEYTTEAPQITEEATPDGKQVTVSAPDELGYTDALAYTTIPEIFGMTEKSKIKIEWQNYNNQNVQFDAFDLNNNGKIDYIEWTVPHLSEQIFNIIYITKAIHLDINKTLLSDIYDQVKERDNIWSETINDGEYVRVTFEIPLNNRRDITLYAKADQSATIEVYTENGNDKIAEFTDIQEDKQYKVLLTNLAEGESYDTFDLKVIGSVEFDYIVDPTISFSAPPTPLDNAWLVPVSNGNFTIEVTGSCNPDPTCDNNEECDIGATLSDVVCDGLVSGAWYLISIGDFDLSYSCNTVVAGGTYQITISERPYEGEPGSCGAAPFVDVSTEVRTVNYDGTAPVSSLIFDFGYVPGTWSTSNVGAIIDCDDDFGVPSSGCDPSNKEYRIDGGDWIVGSNVSVTSDGDHTVDFNSADYAGNIENYQTQAQIMVDKTAPTIQNLTTVYENGTFDQALNLTENTSLINSETCVWSSISDPIDLTNGGCNGGAGPASVTISVEGGVEGTYPIKFSVSDYAGNPSEENFNLVYDTSVPTTSASATAGGSGYTFGAWTNQSSVIATITPSCDSSGCDSPGWTKYCQTSSCDPSSGTAYTVPVTVSTQGTNYFNFASYDRAGNTQTTQEKTIKIDTADPTSVSVSSITADSSSQLTVVGTATDVLSGLHATPYWFTETTGNSGASSSAAYGSASFIDTGLSPNTQYTYKVKARDAATNVSDDSETLSKYTLANIPTTPTLVADSTTQITATWTANSNATGTQYYIENTTNSTNSGWIADLSWASSGLTCNTTYSFKVNAKNGNGVETDFTDSAAVATSACPSTGTGSLPSSPFVPPTAPEGGFSFTINNGEADTDSLNVTLNIKGSSDTARMSVSNEPTFSNSSQEEYQTEKQWTLLEGEGQKTVYVKFYNSRGIASDTITATINYNQVVVPPIVEEITNVANQITDTVSDVANQVAETTRNIAQGIVNIFVPPPLPSSPITTLPPPLTETPQAFKSSWQMVSPNAIRQIVLGNLPRDVKALAQKFPQLQDTLNKLGIAKITDISKLKNVQFILPGLSQFVSEITLPALPQGIPLDNLTDQVKRDIPADVIFARSSGGLIDHNINITINTKGEINQQIDVSKKESLQLVIKSSKQAVSVSGQIIFKSRQIAEVRSELSLNLLAASLLLNSSNPEQQQAVVLQDFNYQDPDKDGIWTADIEAPAQTGQYNILTTINYKDKAIKPKDLSLLTIIDPDGYIYTSTEQGETRIAEARVTLYWFNPEKKEYEVWNAEQFSQQNPQTTDKTGNYSFLAPEGDYYITVSAQGYKDYKSEIINLKQGTAVHKYMELEKKSWLQNLFGF